MRTSLTLFVLLGMALASGAAAAGEGELAELKKFEGEWAVESARKGGKPAPPGEFDTKDRLLFRGRDVALRTGTKEQLDGLFAIDPGKRPRQIDLKLDGKTVEGIYEFAKGRLRICAAEKGQGRPTRFESPEGSQAILLVLKRVKK
jgi:uncharacterized protein (TIGR03067 family)